MKKEYRRILVISYMYPSPERPYSGIYIHRQLRELQQRGHEITVLNPVPWVPHLASRFTRRSPSGVVPHRYVLDDIAVYRIPVLPLWGSSAARFNGAAYLPSLLPTAALLHKRHGFDVVYGHELHRTGFDAVILGKALRLPSIAMGHGSDVHTLPLHDTVIGTMVNWTVRHADRVVVSSDNLREILLGMQPEREDKLFVNPGCIDNSDTEWKSETVTGVREEFGLPTDKQLVLFVGRIIPQKGIQDLLQVAMLSRKNNKNLHFVLVGPCDELPALPKMIREMQLNDLITCTGILPPASVARIMRACDTLVLPSHCEGSPVSVMEAMASYLPVVATTVGGIPDMLDHGVAGYLVRPRDADALSATINQAITQTRETIRRSQRAHAKAHATYTAAASADRFETILASLN